MSEEDKLKTAVLGLDNSGQLLLKSASQIDYFQIQAVADKDTELAEKLATEYKCAAYDDYRQLIIQNQLDCLLVAEGMHNCDEHIKSAMKKKFNILKLAPPARNFEEAVGFVRLAEEENIKFAVANATRFAESYLAFHQFLQQDQHTTKSAVFLITAFCSAGDKPSPSWQSDPKLSGGGVLLHNCYEIIDQIIWNFGTPQQVYSLNTNTADDKAQRPYLTEDTAIITMKFTDCSFGNLVANRLSKPKQRLLKAYCKDRILTVSDTQFTVSNGTGRTNEQLQYDDNQLIWQAALLKNFALSILFPDENELCSSGKENLKNMAVIESAYLSARTGFPEEPARILKGSPNAAYRVWEPP